MAAMGGAGGPAPPGYTLPNAKLTEEERWEKSIWDQLKGVDTDSIPGIQAINAEIDRLHGLITGTDIAKLAVARPTSVARASVVTKHPTLIRGTHAHNTHYPNPWC
jgi:hypothetical protein